MSDPKPYFTGWDNGQPSWEFYRGAGPFKYRLTKPYSILLFDSPFVGNVCYAPTFDGVQPLMHVARQEWVNRVADGRRLMAYQFTLGAGYAWDGCSGPTIDRPANTRGGLVHDGLYHLGRVGLLSESHRKWADLVFRELMLLDGFTFAGTYYLGVRAFGRSSFVRRKSANSR